MAYTDTNSLTGIDATKPVGSDAPSTLDDALRETRLVFKTVLSNAHQDKGAIRIALFQYNINSTVATASNNQFNRLPLSITTDPTGLLGTGTYTNTTKPIAGTYLVRFFGSCGSGNHFQCRIFEAVNNTLSPEGGTPVAGLVSGVCFGSDARQSHGSGILVADGIKSYSLALINDSSGNIATAGGTNSVAGTSAQIEFIYLGSVTS